MKVLGLIVEYNPFHNGHLYHLEESKRLTGADCTICVMSGSFIQRGEPALVNKWARAKMALLAGADLVVELPVVYAMSSAEYFAYGAVKILDSLGVVDYISFGSESGRLDELEILAEILNTEPAEYKTFLKKELDKGISYPAAREAGIKAYIRQQGVCGEETANIMNSSNNILGIEYIRALKNIRSSIIPYTIKRLANSYNSDELTETISSATAIRKHISEKNKSQEYLQKLRQVLPETSCKILEEEFQNGRGPVFAENFDEMLLAQIRSRTTESLKELPYITEGLENRIKAAGNNSGTVKELIDNICTKRYPRTRIQRTIFNLLTSVTADEMECFRQYGGPKYIRILGFNSKGRYLLSEINKSGILPVINKTAYFRKSCNKLLVRMLEIEAFSTDMYVLAYENPEYRRSGQEFTNNPIRIGL